MHQALPELYALDTGLAEGEWSGGREESPPAPIRHLGFASTEGCLDAGAAAADPRPNGHVTHVADGLGDSAESTSPEEGSVETWSSSLRSSAELSPPAAGGGAGDTPVRRRRGGRGHASGGGRPHGGSGGRSPSGSGGIPLGSAGQSGVSGACSVGGTFSVGGGIPGGGGGELCLNGGGGGGAVRYGEGDLKQSRSRVPKQPRLNPVEVPSPPLAPPAVKKGRPEWQAVGPTLAVEGHLDSSVIMGSPPISAEGESAAGGSAASGSPVDGPSTRDPAVDPPSGDRAAGRPRGRGSTDGAKEGSSPVRPYSLSVEPPSEAANRGPQQRTSPKVRFSIIYLSGPQSHIPSWKLAPSALLLPFGGSNQARRCC